jgi:hypothetical protein
VFHNFGIHLIEDPLQPSGLRVLENPGNIDERAFAWDAVRHTLTIAEWLVDGGTVTVEIAPAD